MNIDDLKELIARGAEQLSRKYRSIGLPPELPEGKTYLDLLRERDPLTWKRFDDSARSALIHGDTNTHVTLSFEEFNTWLELRGLKPMWSAPDPYATWAEYWAVNDKHPVKETGT